MDASADGPVPGALRDLDATVTAERGSPGLVADLLRLPGDDVPVSWERIANKPRGETGRALLEVLTTFGDQAGGLRRAVGVDYQQEADAALLGTEYRVSPKQ